MTSLICLAAVLYFEARSEPPDAQAAVAGVVLERVASDRWPDTICEVALQPYQFSAFNNGIPQPRDKAAWSASMLLARMILDDPDGTVQMSGATHYHTVDVKPYWAKHYKYLGRRGAHLFYGAPDGL